MRPHQHRAAQVDVDQVDDLIDHHVHAGAKGCADVGVGVLTRRAADSVSQAAEPGPQVMLAHRCPAEAALLLQLLVALVGKEDAAKQSVQRIEQKVQHGQGGEHGFQHNAVNTADPHGPQPSVAYRQDGDDGKEQAGRHPAHGEVGHDAHLEQIPQQHHQEELELPLGSLPQCGQLPHGASSS